MNITQILTLINRGVRITLEQRLRDVLAPAHMQGPWSRKWWGTIGAFAELFWQGAQQAADVGFPDTAPNDALDYVGSNENIERLILEPDGTYRDRLRDPFTTWEDSGRIAGIEGQLAAWGLTGSSVYDLGAGWVPGDGNADSAWRFWTVIEQPPVWSLLVAGEDVIASDDSVAGVAGMNQTDYRNLRRIIHKWRSAHSTPVKAFLIFSGALGATTTAAADALIASEDAVDLPITWPQAGDDMYAGGGLYAGWYIEPR